MKFRNKHSFMSGFLFYHEVLSELAMNSYSINTDFGRIVPQLKGLPLRTGEFFSCH